MTALPKALELKQQPVPAEEISCYDARALIGAHETARIVLDEQVYTLRITKSGKLILTK